MTSDAYRELLVGIYMFWVVIPVTVSLLITHLIVLWVCDRVKIAVPDEYFESIVWFVKFVARPLPNHSGIIRIDDCDKY